MPRGRGSVSLIAVEHAMRSIRLTTPRTASERAEAAPNSATHETLPFPQPEKLGRGFRGLGGGKRRGGGRRESGARLDLRLGRESKPHYSSARWRVFHGMGPNLGGGAKHLLRTFRPPADGR